jgi:hypothetical protein
MLEDRGCVCVAPARDVYTRLLVEPPIWQTEFVGYRTCLVHHNSVWFEQGVDVSRCTSCVVGQCHRCAAEHVYICRHAATRQALAQSGQCAADSLTIKQRPLAHATSNSCGAMNTPRRRNAAGACTNASARAARVLKGNQNLRSPRPSAHPGAARSTLAAKCSAKAPRKTSQRSSPVPPGSASSRASRVPAGSWRYSSRNSATSRQRSSCPLPASHPARSASEAARYGFGIPLAYGFL